jgi:hypothetical protein
MAENESLYLRNDKPTGEFRNLLHMTIMKNFKFSYEKEQRIQSKGMKFWFFSLLIFVFLYTNSADSKGQILDDLYKHKGGVSRNSIQYEVQTIEPGKEIVLAKIEGAGLITYFYITDNSQGNIYQGLVLKIYWDGSKEPSVNVPLADFFGAIKGKAIDYESMLMQINHYCYMSYIPMPFSHGACIILKNDGDSVYKRIVAYNIDYIKDSTFKNNDMRFHCYWNRSNPTHGRHELLNIKGDGHYIGNFLQVSTKSKKWWGEGDTDFMIDGEPVKHTPGTEDEYGACWEFGHKYTFMYSGYIENINGENRMYRWYLANPIVFKNQLSVTIQNNYVKPGSVFNLAKQDEANDDYRSIAYWYQRGIQTSHLQLFHERTDTSKAEEY